MQLGQPKPLRTLNEHDRGIGHVDPNFDNGSRHEHVELAVAKTAHHHILLGGPHATVQQPELERLQFTCAQPFVLLNG